MILFVVGIVFLSNLYVVTGQVSRVKILHFCFRRDAAEHKHASSTSYLPGGCVSHYTAENAKFSRQFCCIFVLIMTVEHQTVSSNIRLQIFIRYPIVRCSESLKYQTYFLGTGTFELHNYYNRYFI